MAKTQKLTRMCASCSAVVDASVAVCSGCRGQLMREVQDANDLLRELDIDFARQSRKSNSVGRKTAESPVFFNVGASDSIRALRTAVRSLARDATPEAVALFRDARHQAYRTIDIPRIRRFIGACNCVASPGVPVYAPEGQDSAPCPRCGVEWHLDERDDWEYLGRVTGPLETLRAHMLTLKVERSRSQLRRDIAKAGTEPVGIIGDVRHFRLTDVLQASFENGARQSVA